MKGSYVYAPATGTISTPWTVDEKTYLTPTPFTEWILRLDRNGGDLNGATRLLLTLRVSYRTAD